MNEDGQPDRLFLALERFMDMLASHPPLSWLDRVLRGPVGPTE